MERNGKERQPWCRENWITRWDFLFKKNLHFLPHFTWEQGSGRDKNNRAMWATPIPSTAFTTGSLCLSLFEPKKSQRRQHIKMAHLGNSEKPQKKSYRNHEIKNKPQPARRNGRAMAVELRGRLLFNFQKWTKTHLLSLLGCIFCLVQPVHSSDSFYLPRVQMCQCAGPLPKTRY